MELLHILAKGMLLSQNMLYSLMFKEISKRFLHVLSFRQAATILVNGLKRLEYRGYDSAGVGLIVEKDSNHSIHITKKQVSMKSGVFSGR